MIKEKKLTFQISEFLQQEYPNVVFTCDASGLRLPIPLAVQLKRQRSRHAIPDLLILSPSPDGKYHFMVLELKTEKNSPFLRNGNLSTDKHVQEQAFTLGKLKLAGAYAEFAVGLEDAKNKINQYFNR